MSRVISRVHTNRPELERMQSHLRDAHEEIRQSPLHTGRQIDGIVIAANTDTVVEHGLGRKLQGFWVVRKNADTSIFESTTENPAPNNTIILRAGVAVTASLWVY